MKILLRVIGYLGVFLLVISVGIGYGYPYGLLVGGGMLIAIAVVESVIKYG